MAALVAGCSQPAPDERDRIPQAHQYFADNNAASRQGPQAQQDFFDHTQHPDFTSQTCELGDMTVDLKPAWSTLRPDPGFAPDTTGPPRGSIWTIGVEVTSRRDQAIVGRQIGSLHLTFLDGRVYGFAPCPS